MTRSRSITRRSFVLAGAAAVASPVLGYGRTAYTDLTCGLAGGLVVKPKPERAVSLRQLSEAAMSGKPAELDGLTRLDGIVLDRENRDIILWGLAERGQPSLFFPDFVIALRSSFGRYLVRKDGVDYRVAPLISIDPDTNIWRKLNQLNLADADAEAQRSQLCKSPQAVRVEGMPRNTRVAKTLVDADYRMKMVSQGIVRLPIKSPFTSSFEAQVAKAREDVIAGTKSSDHHNTRYWFEPGRFTYQVSEEGDTFFVDSAKVVLNDEDQFLNGGKLDATGKVDEIARAFTCAWTSRMEDVYKAEPIWRDMHNIFRHFALARMMADRDAFGKASFASEFLLDRYELPKVALPDSLPGIGRVEKYQTKNGRMTSFWQHSVCGGVSVGFNKPLEEQSDKGGTRVAGRDILAARPTGTTVAWAVTSGSLRGIMDKSEPKSSPTPATPSTPSAPPAGKSLRDLFKT